MSLALSCVECKSLNIILQGDYKPGRIRGFWSWNVSPRCNNRKFFPAPKVFVCTSWSLFNSVFLHAHISIELCHDKSVPFFLTFIHSPLFSSFRQTLQPSTCLQCSYWSLTRLEVPKREAEAVKLPFCFPHNPFSPTQSSLWVITHLRAASLYLSSCQLLPWDHGDLSYRVH